MSLALLIGNYNLGKDTGEATFVTWNGHPAHFEWDHKPTGKERQDALAAAQKLTGHRLKTWGAWFNPRTGLHFVSADLFDAQNEKSGP